MRHILIIFLFLFSCNNNNTKDDIISIYKEIAEQQKDTITFKELKILESKKVDYEFLTKININTLFKTIKDYKNILELELNTIKLLKNNISRYEKLIQLNNYKKEKYLLDIDRYKRKIEYSNINIEKTENDIAITNQKIVLLKFEKQKTEKDFQYIKYIFKGTINNDERIDTLILIKREKKYIFVKNDIFSDYLGQ